MGETRLDVQLPKQVDGFCLDASWSMGNELAVLFGYSGSGKTMTMRMIAGLVRPDSGRIVRDGEVLYDSESKRSVPPQERQFGFVGQDLALFPHMTVAKNIAYGLKGLSREESHERVAEFIRLLHLRGLGVQTAPRDLRGAAAAGRPGEGAGQPAQGAASGRALLRARRTAEGGALGGHPRGARGTSHPYPGRDPRPVDAHTVADRIIVYRRGPGGAGRHSGRRALRPGLARDRDARRRRGQPRREGGVFDRPGARLRALASATERGPT